MEEELEAVENHIESLKNSIDALQDLYDNISSHFVITVTNAFINTFGYEVGDSPEAEEVLDDIAEVEDILDDQEDKKLNLKIDIAIYKHNCGY